MLSLGYAYPLPWKLMRRFIDGHRLILIAEEPKACIESQLQMSPKVRGRLTGHLPWGPLERSDLVKALESLEKRIEKGPQVYEIAAERGYKGICDDCLYIPLLRALAELDAPVAGDAGCAIRATRKPYESVDVVYGLGSSVGVASGFGKKGVAVIGDFALAHSGLQALINAVWQKREVLVVLLKNDVAAMTGGQESPDLTGLLEGLVPTRRLELPCSEGAIERALSEELAREGPSAVVVEGRCSRYG
ncbi:Indolepyruvate oxidoreductase subunit IorA [uncultured archaeon]|nr:Indolepyruvate oxidoreductase subunit IorA [uncultured archaeon]